MVAIHWHYITCRTCRLGVSLTSSTTKQSIFPISTTPASFCLFSASLFFLSLPQGPLLESLGTIFHERCYLTPLSIFDLPSYNLSWILVDLLTLLRKHDTPLGLLIINYLAAYLVLRANGFIFGQRPRSKRAG
ncbi:hypothetical protein F5B19DRAFT_471939 [Rostrohypoxylon terebratum]|nr:hypothetical protein F5B19DRAFT_471939 [Rostrohypoxylon terebratum]